MFKLTVVLLIAAVAVAFRATTFSSRSSFTQTMAAKSKSLPFLPQPPNIVGLVGDVGECSL